MPQSRRWIPEIYLLVDENGRPQCTSTTDMNSTVQYGSTVPRVHSLKACVLYISRLDLLPRAHVQGIKQSVLSVCHLSVVITKIARSGDLGVIVRYVYHYGIGNVGKPTFFWFLDAWEGLECYKSCLSIWHTFWPHPVMPCAVTAAPAWTVRRYGSSRS